MSNFCTSSNKHHGGCRRNESIPILRSKPNTCIGRIRKGDNDSLYLIRLTMLYLVWKKRESFVSNPDEVIAPTTMRMVKPSTAVWTRRRTTSTTYTSTRGHTRAAGRSSRLPYVLVGIEQKIIIPTAITHLALYRARAARVTWRTPPRSIWKLFFKEVVFFSFDLDSPLFSFPLNLYPLLA